MNDDHADRAIYELGEALFDLKVSAKKFIDPVALRRSRVRTALQLRRTANLLDDEGRLTE